MKKNIIVHSKNHIGAVYLHKKYIVEYFLIGPDIFRIVINIETFFPNVKIMEEANFIRKQLVNVGELKYKYSYSLKNLKKAFYKVAEIDKTLLAQHL
jgi:hypothetical protein